MLVTACAGAGPVTPARIVVALGDSVPAGTACGCDPFPVLYARAQRAAAVNLAVPGATSADVLNGLPAARGPLTRADEVLVMAGANDVAPVFRGDYATAAAGVRTAVAATIAGIQGIHPVPVVVLGYWSIVPDGRAGATDTRAAAKATAAVNDALRAAAHDSGARYVDTEPAFHGSDGAMDPTPLLAPDGDHPDAQGHAAIAALLPPLQGRR
ncbi:SGNH/GDSL hydrolase family protein [Couchioplanes caeruleus]|uniref:SGNH/GDSL hydrolase family protein n=1 Tax=Couchioplanes caeruleus TaxID=56438 RepID=UPI0020C045A6|nr:SGNH/GDSL hydrolase family protein [Couchioplanes caeruleus]UQU62397.1 SGNH/GDSL hydrolase family protein [Couchioplanes caeruleus]